jgi:hypothetical protein
VLLIELSQGQGVFIPEVDAAAPNNVSCNRIIELSHAAVVCQPRAHNAMMVFNINDE